MSAIDRIRLIRIHWTVYLVIVKVVIGVCKIIGLAPERLATQNLLFKAGDAVSQAR